MVCDSRWTAYSCQSFCIRLWRLSDRNILGRLFHFWHCVISLFSAMFQISAWHLFPQVFVKKRFRMHWKSWKVISYKPMVVLLLLWPQSLWCLWSWQEIWVAWAQSVAGSLKYQQFRLLCKWNAWRKNMPGTTKILRWSIKREEKSKFLEVLLSNISHFVDYGINYDFINIISIESVTASIKVYAIEALTHLKPFMKTKYIQMKGRTFINGYENIWSSVIWAYRPWEIQTMFQIIIEYLEWPTELCSTRRQVYFILAFLDGSRIKQYEQVNM